jgi:hypothetical protein
LNTSSPNLKKTFKKTKFSPLKKCLPKGLVTGIKCLTKKEDLVFVELIYPGILCAYVVKETDHNKPAFVNELVKALKNEDKIVQELGVNAMTLCKLYEEGNKCLMYDGYPICMFIKYLEDDHTYK